MPTSVAEHTIVVSRVAESFSIPTDNHWVTAITLLDINENTRPNDAWGIIGLAQADTQISNRIATVAQGYLGRANDIFWTGKLIADPNTVIFAQVNGTTTRKYRLVVILNPIITTEGNLIVVDP
jgi:hypothetical protein